MPRLAGTSNRVLLTLGALVAAILPIAAVAPSASATTVQSESVQSESAQTIYGNGPLLFPDNDAARAATALAGSDPAGAAAAATLAQYPTAKWLGDWVTGSALVTALQRDTAAAAANGTTAVFVTYAIPDRDCGGYSAGGFTESAYDAWVDTIAATIAGTRSVVIVEPDSLAMLGDASCNATDATVRDRILSREVSEFTADGIPSYLDAGHEDWVAPATMAARLQAAGVANARGFFSNVANYYSVDGERAYDQQVSALLGGAHYVIDTSRDGQGYGGTWCNAPGAGLGATGRVVNDGTPLDALLWVKTPGQSDGPCNGGPAAGLWFSAAAQTLVANAQLDAPILPAASVSRIAGTDAFDTAAQVALSHYSSASTVYVASRSTFPDALGAGAVAARAGAPVLLTAEASLPSATASALTRLHPSAIVVVGGPAAVSDAVVQQLEQYAPVRRVAGTDRYATSAALADTFPAGPSVAYVTTGLNFPDALSGSALAASTTGSGPVLLVQPDAVPAAVGAALDSLRPQRIVVLGGSAAVSDSVLSALQAFTSGSVTRVSGADRYATSAAVAADGNARPAVVYIATGAGFADALAAAPIAGVSGAPLLLVAPSAVPSAIATELRTLNPSAVVIVGGTSAVAPSVASAL